MEIIFLILKLQSKFSSVYMPCWKFWEVNQCRFMLACIRHLQLLSVAESTLGCQISECSTCSPESSIRLRAVSLSQLWSAYRFSVRIFTYLILAVVSNVEAIVLPKDCDVIPAYHLWIGNAEVVMESLVHISSNVDLNVVGLLNIELTIIVCDDFSYC